MPKVNYDDTLYPRRLKVLPDAPKELYYKGNISETVLAHTLAVVGSRYMTNYGREMCERFVYDMVGLGVTIISGFMFGIDITAHSAALAYGGATVSVMPCGIDLISPAYEHALYSQIEQTGAIISEYPQKFPPKRWTFVKRNRIVAGLSDAVLIVEAAANSGSLHTAKFAATFGIPVFAIPGNINSEKSQGTLKLIASGAASLVYTSKTLTDFFSSKYPSLRQTMSTTILELLKKSPRTLDNLASCMNVPSTAIVNALNLLELQDQISRKGLLYYVS